MLIVDDLHEMSNQRGGRDRFLKAVHGRYGLTVLLADTEFVIEELHGRRGEERPLVEFDRMQLCEFGYLRVEQLARRWMVQNRADGTTLREQDVKRICDIVERVLRINAIPHHPWVLLVLLQEAESSEAPAAKNGSYGHLYQAIITVALSRSRLKVLDISGKYTYLGELAYAMYQEGSATFDDAEARAFHGRHCEKYDVLLNYDHMIEDLIACQILRRDEGRVSFRAKYSYCFFVAWYIARNIHSDESKALVSDLCQELHHEDSANVFLFLTHLAGDPLIIGSITATAKRLFASAPLANLNEDMTAINALQPDEIRLRLPDTDPEENWRKSLEEKDETLSRRDPSTTDGRQIKPHPPSDEEGGSDDELKAFLWDLRASLRTIEILGQVLRNGAGSISAEEKQQLLDEIYRLARRIYGYVLADLPDQMTGWAVSLYYHFSEEYPDETPERRASRIVRHIFNSLCLVTYSLALRVSHAVAHDLLGRTFDRVLQADGSIPNQLFDLGVKLDLAHALPMNQATKLYKEMEGNPLVRSAITALVGNHLYLHRVPEADRQAISKAVGIDLDPAAFDASRKKTRALLPGPKDQKERRQARKSERDRKKKDRQRDRK